MTNAPTVMSGRFLFQEPAERRNPVKQRSNPVKQRPNPGTERSNPGTEWFSHLRERFNRSH